MPNFAKSGHTASYAKIGYVLGAGLMGASSRNVASAGVTSTYRSWWRTGSTSSQTTPLRPHQEASKEQLPAARNTRPDILCGVVTLDRGVGGRQNRTMLGLEVDFGVQWHGAALERPDSPASIAPYSLLYGTKFFLRILDGSQFGNSLCLLLLKLGWEKRWCLPISHQLLSQD